MSDLISFDQTPVGVKHCDPALVALDMRIPRCSELSDVKTPGMVPFGVLLRDEEVGPVEGHLLLLNRSISASAASSSSAITWTSFAS